MDKDIIKTLIKEFQETALPKLFPRDIEIPLSSSKIVALTGPRRSGKTSLIFLLVEKLIANGVLIEQIVYINFDNPRLLPATARDLETIMEGYWELYPQHRDKINYLFLDEIQNVKDWELGIRRIYDTKKFNLFITGSSSKLLSQEIATDLRGRAVGFEVLPFSFKELLWTKGITVDKNLEYSQERFNSAHYLEDYLDTGGFPEIVFEKEPAMTIRILKEYIETMFFKDLIERYHIKNQSLLRELIKYLVTNTASLFSLTAFYKWIKQTYPVTKRTLINYLGFLENVGLFFFIRKFSYSLKEQTQTLRKVYLLDNGFRKVYGFKFSEDKGKILENTVFLELKHRQAKDPLLEIYYWQDYQKKEVDFVVKQGENVTAIIQVCARLNDLKIRERELSSLIKASEELKCDNLIVISLEFESQETIKDKKVVFVPLWKWMLGLY